MHINEEKNYEERAFEDEKVCTGLNFLSLVFSLSEKANVLTFVKVKQQSAQTKFMPSLVCLLHLCFREDSTKQGYTCEILGTEDMTMHNSAIKMDINDPLDQFIELQIEMFLKLFLSRKTISDSLTEQHSKQVLWQNVVGTSSVKSAEK